MAQSPIGAEASRGASARRVWPGLATAQPAAQLQPALAQQQQLKNRPLGTGYLPASPAVAIQHRVSTEAIIRRTPSLWCCARQGARLERSNLNLTSRTFLLRHQLIICAQPCMTSATRVYLLQPSRANTHHSQPPLQPLNVSTERRRTGNLGACRKSWRTPCEIPAPRQLRCSHPPHWFVWLRAPSTQLGRKRSASSRNAWLPLFDCSPQVLYHDTNSKPSARQSAPFEISPCILSRYHGPLAELAHQRKPLPPLPPARLTVIRYQLANGLSMPRIHLGVYLTQGKECHQAVQWALEVCRFFSSAPPAIPVELHSGHTIMRRLPSYRTQCIQSEFVWNHLSKMLTGVGWLSGVGFPGSPVQDFCQP